MKNRILKYLYLYIKNNFNRIPCGKINSNAILDCRGLGLDSIEVMSLFFDVESAFQIEIQAKDYYRIHTLIDLAAYIEKKLKEDSFLQYCRQYGEKIAVIDEEKKISYAELGVQIQRAAEKMHEWGMQEEDTVLLTLENCWKYPVLFFAILETGAVPVLADRTAKAEWTKMAKDSFAAFVLLNEMDVEVSGFDYIGEIIGVQVWKRMVVEKKNAVLQEAYLIHYTSGSTGSSNGVVHDLVSFRNMITGFRKDFPITGKETFLAALPFSHGYGLSCVFLSGLYAGSKLVMMHRFEPKGAVSLMKAKQVTHLFAVPPMFELILRVMKRNGDTLPELQYCCSSSLMLSYDLISQFYVFTGKVINQEYGSAEIGVAAYSKFSTLPDTEKCVGRLLYPECYRITEDGELYMFTPEMAIGYTSGKRFSKEFGTQDLVKLENELLYLEGRVKNLLECGGHKVFAEEVRQNLLNTGLFQDVHVCSASDNNKYIRAFIVPKQPFEVDREQLVDILNSEMDSYKIPAEFCIVSEIISNNMGKVTQECIRLMEEKSSIL